MTAFGGGDHPAAARSAPASAIRLLPAGPPAPQVISRIGPLHLQLPVNQSRVTAIGYAGGGDGALALEPVGAQANEGLLKRLCAHGGRRRRQHAALVPAPRRPGTAHLGARRRRAVRTDVYAPVDGTIVGIAKVVLNGRRTDSGSTSSRPARLARRLALAAERRPVARVGATVTAASSKLGRVLDFSKVERQALARHTNDAGNHVLLEVRTAATLSP